MFLLYTNQYVNLQVLSKISRAKLLKAWLALTQVKHHDNL